MEQPLVVPDAAGKHQPKFSLKAARKEFFILFDWLQEICQYRKFEDFVYISDHKPGEIRLKIFTKDHFYSIVGRPPKATPCDCKKCGGHETMFRYLVASTPEYDWMKCDKCGLTEKNAGYLGTYGHCRKGRAGEAWTRGNDLPDGPYNRMTWNAFKDRLISYEIVKVVRNSPDVNER